MPTVKPIPEGFHSITPYMIFRDAAAAIDFYQKAFGATELMRMPGPDGSIGHAEIRIGDSVIMLADESPQWKALSAKHYGGSPIKLLIYTPDVDQVVATALAAGATLDMAVEDRFYGDRVGVVSDPFGHQWYIHTHIKDVSEEELAAAAKEMFESGQPTSS